MDHSKWNVRWSDLSKEQKARHNMIANYLVSYCEQNINTLVRWEEIDKQVPHIYSWIFEAYNLNNSDKKLVFDDKGVKIVRVRRCK